MFENIIHLWEGSGGGQLCTSLIYSTKKSLMLENWNTLGPLWHVDSGLLQLKNDKHLQISLSIQLDRLVSSTKILWKFFFQKSSPALYEVTSQKTVPGDTMYSED